MPISARANSRCFPISMSAIGPVVEEVTQDFERYWRSRSVSTLDNVLDVEAEEIDARVQLPPHWKDDPVAQRYLERLESTRFASYIETRTLPLVWAKTRLLSDDPRKGQGESAPTYPPSAAHDDAHRRAQIAVRYHLLLFCADARRRGDATGAAS